ncbi:hypothetical protein CAI21_19955 [Alkalilimnicola ehrlichii]|uniref:Polysaccharide chain length determinant N-terminal domain-containing protein n=1 Tax=Alkalilimnicola ehrlichii TaxID=351052 RepID=A0A3E0WIS5_9GAMM|nr:XrtA system polysaccharide chain length determinant [Alkalilimnicola ehrlichii]RFA25168.1 hypothetical protein CAI21_19955 [Alkalilimnicola ehrlichii]RFA32123.1 hypothetical protein CAL65_20540 [Alkalilimnicola ehrlichii]
MQTETEERLKVFYREAFARRRLMVTSFVVITVVMLLVGMNWPRTYESSTTIMIEEQNIIEPLMAGAAVSTDISDRAHNASELIFSRAILMQVLEHGDWLDDDPSPVEIEYMLDGLRGSTNITQVSRNLIRISYTGGDPEQVYQTTEKLANLFVEEMAGSKSQESDAAFAFIDQQVRQYEQELQRSEERLQELRARNPDARPGAREEVAARVARLQERMETLEQSLREAYIAERSLEEQLSGEAEGATGFSRAERIRDRIAELESELDTLRLTYHDTYPDVITLKHQIEDLNQALAQEEEREASGEPRADDFAIRANPVYQELQGRLYDARTTIRTLRASLEDTEQRLQQEQARAASMEEVEAELAKLLRDYEVNQGIYEDLQLRRENARVSMNLSRDHQGLHVRVYEPPYFAHQPDGPRLAHFVLGGFLLGAALPLALLFLFVLLDPRVRTGTSITDDLELHLLGVVPHMATPAEARQERRSMIISALVVMATVGVVFLFLLFR